MGLFSKRRQEPEKQNSSPQRQFQSPSTVSVPTSQFNRLAKTQRVPSGLDVQSTKGLPGANNDTDAAAKSINTLELELARQRTRIRQLEDNEQKMKQAVAISTQVQSGIFPSVGDLSAARRNASNASLSQRQRKDSAVVDGPSSVLDSPYHAPELVAGGLHSNFRSYNDSTLDASSSLITTHERRANWYQESSSDIHATEQYDQQPSSFESPPPPPPQAPGFDVGNVIEAISSLPWAEVFGAIADNGSNPGLLLLLFALLYFTYSIIMKRALYLLLAFVTGIVIYNARKIFYISKQAELHREHMRSIAQHVQTIDMVPPTVDSSRLLLPAGMNRVEEEVD